MIPIAELENTEGMAREIDSLRRRLRDAQTLIESIRITDLTERKRAEAALNAASPWRPRVDSSFRWKVRTSIAAVVVILLTLGVAAVHTTNALSEEGHWVAHTSEVLTHVSRMNSTLSQAQSNARAYVITGRGDFKDANVELVAETEQEYAQLRSLTAHNPHQQAKLDQTHVLLISQLALVRAAFSRTGPALSDAFYPGNLMVETKLMELFWQNVNELKGEEGRLIENRLRESAKTAWRNELIALFGACISLLVVLGASRMIVRDNAARVQAHVYTRSLIEASIDPMIMKGPDGKITDVNVATENATGRTRAQLIGTEFADCFTDREMAHQLHERVYREGSVRDYPLEIRHANGSTMPVMYNGCVYRDASGLVAGAITSARDITETKKRELAALQLAAVVKCSSDAIIGKDANGIVTSWNASAERVFGYSAEEMIGQSINLLFPPNRREEEAELLSRLKRGQRVDDYETERLKKDGTLVAVAVTISAIRDSSGQFIGFSKAARDISERKRAEAELRTSENRFRSLVESTSALVWTADSHGQVVDMPAWRDITGQSKEEVCGNGWLQAVHPEDRERVKAVRDEALATAGLYEVEYRLRLRDGAYRDVQVRGVPVRLASGDILEWVGTCTDITEQKRLQDELAKAKEAAEAANRAKSEFLANMSHEIRTPMAAIIGFADMVLYKDQGKAARVEWADIIQRNARHLLELINEILDLSKLEASQMKVERVECDLQSLLSEMASFMRPRAVEKGLGFAITFQGAIPRLIQTDPMRLRQILVNLVGNGLKFTEAGQIAIRIADEGAGAANIVLRVDVTDSGIGMTQDQVARLFQPFTQGDTSITRKFGGTGLGLTISRRFAQLLNGDISVTSEVGVGSTFTLKIDGGPSAGVERLQDLTEAKLPAALGPGVQAVIRLHGRILLAEDGRDNQRLLRMYLGEAGAEVVIAENGQIAVKLATAEPFDLILMDMQMPIMDGYTATAELRGKGLTTPIIGLTAYAMAEDRAKCLACGCSDYLSKPVAPERLLSTIRHHLNPQNQQEQAVQTGDSQQIRVKPETHPTGPIRSTLMDYPGLSKIIIEFVGDLPARVRELEDFLKQQDLDRLRRLAHQLRGACGGFGFDCITEAAAKAEDAIRSGQPPLVISNCVDSLIQIIRRVAGFDKEESRIAA